VSINFEVEQSNKTLIFDSIPDGSNTFKLGEIVLLGSTYSLLNLLSGFPSYLSLVAALGGLGVGKNVVIQELLCLSPTI
jgi:xanthosine utilization system XapX-like protein